jgi:hypothetical protein
LIEKKNTIKTKKFGANAFDFIIWLLIIETNYINISIFNIIL